ncbi:ABC transporter ATP-binding protein [PVC group bacterium]|nr:ABC transporter ATP-binding protein [PVC group bacterium]
MLEMNNITKTYEAPDDAAGLSVLSDLSVHVKKGEALAIVGPSGSGKSTFLNIAGTLDRPTSGSVLLNNRDITALSDSELAGIRCREIGFIFQLHHLLPQCTVLENVLMPTLPNAANADPAEANERALQLLIRVGLEDRISYRPGQLSGGECQRVAVVRALINNPVILLADEPTGSLDRTTAESLTDLLLSLNKEEGLTLLVVTHSEKLANHMSRTLNLLDGKLRA